MNLFLIGLIVLWGVLGRSNGRIINCLVNNWSGYQTGDGHFEPSNIDPNLCTHLSYSAFGIDESGEFKMLDSWLALNKGYISKIIALKQMNPKLKVMAVVGGWLEGSVKYSQMAANASKRRSFIDSTLKFINEFGFDGLDLDWEFPAQSDKENYVTLLNETKSALTAWNKVLSITVAAPASLANKSYIIPEISKLVDFINVMAYDFASYWDGVVGFNAPLKGQGENNVESAIKYWLEQGAPASKLVLGLAFFGRTYTLSNPEEFTLGSATIGAGKAGAFTGERGYIGYNEICTIENTWSSHWASENRVPFLHKSDQLISYDNDQSIKLKVYFAKSLNLTGVMVSTIDTDDFLGNCGVKYPLLKIVNNTIRSVQGTNASNVDLAISQPSTDNNRKTERPHRIYFTDYTRYFCSV